MSLDSKRTTLHVYSTAAFIVAAGVHSISTMVLDVPAVKTLLHSEGVGRDRDVRAREICRYLMGTLTFMAYASHVTGFFILGFTLTTYPSTASKVAFTLFSSILGLAVPIIAAYYIS
jgi:hypothetical protein